MDGKTGHGASITVERIAQLNAIGFEWSIYEGTGLKGWHDKFQLLCAFQHEHGHCRVPHSFLVDSDNLGHWVNHQKEYYRNHLAGKIGKHASITEERIALLNGIGFEWSIREGTGLDEKGWQRKFQLLCAFQREHGHCRVPKEFVIDSEQLGHWVHNQRNQYKNYMLGKTGTGASITSERISQLYGIGFEWKIKEGIDLDEKEWQHFAFQREHGHCRVPQKLEVVSV
jgi:hypothetical protein